MMTTMFTRSVLTLTILAFGSVSSFFPACTYYTTSSSSCCRNTQNQSVGTTSSCLHSKNKKNPSKEGADAAAKQNNHQSGAFAVGAFVEFEEKKHRVHVGKITNLEYKSNGGARYDVTDSDGKNFQIADKAIHFAMNPPNSPGPANQLFKEFCQAQTASDQELQTQLDITPEILELAWEEALLESSSSDHVVVTPESLIELVHSHAASTMEKYKAWRLLQSDVSHIFFKEIKDHGRIASFKVRARKAVESAKRAFCMQSDHAHNELCLI